jgi:3-deoxy-7-phosphoheptulonate synthase
MYKDINILDIKPIIAPIEVQTKYTPLPENIDFIIKSRKEISAILNGEDNRMIVVVGPCSIHDYDAAIAYAKQLTHIQESVKNLYLVMRVYFEKPRSRTGWKGFIYDPEINNTNNINKGLDLARKLLLEIVKMGIPVGCEFLDLITPQYVSDLVSWGAIGARTSESQTHRQLASGLSMPIGFKNLTSGDCVKAINGIISARESHNFMSIDDHGRVSQVQTRGNITAHLILRGGEQPNYQENHVAEISKILEKEGLETGMIIDCSHGNSQSEYNRQILVALYVKRLRMLNKYPIRGIMLESNINKGKQQISPDMRYGVSVTDGCIDISTTATLIKLLDNTNLCQSQTLGENRKIIRDYDKTIYEILQNQGNVNLKNHAIQVRAVYERDGPIVNICKGKPNEEELMMMLSLRLSISERIAEIKFANNPFAFLNKNNDLLNLVTDREIEKENFKLFSNPVFLKIMELSKNIQVEYLENFLPTVKIGYLFGRGTFSGEAITNNFRGVHVVYQSISELRSSLENGTIAFMVLPTYNSLIGEIFPIESYWAKNGSIDHRINLNLYSNKNTKPEYADVLYVEPHIQKEAAHYIQNKFKVNLEIVETHNSLDGCIECIKNTEQIAMTISSKHNNSNFLHVIDSEIVDHNVTTFSLISL